MPQNTERCVELPVEPDGRLHQLIRSHELRAALTALAFAVGTGTGIEQPITAAAARITPPHPGRCPRGGHAMTPREPSAVPRSGSTAPSSRAQPAPAARARRCSAARITPRIPAPAPGEAVP
ncbi:MAG: hypothetical protein U9R72_10820 [Chloroflexota bacterium]|nr:hypothetical protein [Chloroflexota bacterium]